MRLWLEVEMELADVSIACLTLQYGSIPESRLLTAGTDEVKKRLYDTMRVFLQSVIQLPL